MTETNRVARNVIWNWAGTVAHLLAGFVVAPFLVRRLGDTDYGVWVLIASMTAYLGLLDAGLRGALGRNIAFFKAKNDTDGANSVVSTGFALLIAGAIFVMAATFLAKIVFFQMFDVSAESAANVDTALLLIGLTLAISFAFCVFECVLWANQRFDLLNLIDIPAVGLRIVLTFWLVGNDSGSFVTLGWIHVLVALATGLGMASACFLTDRNLRLSPRLVWRNTVGKLYDFGIWCFLLSVAQITSKYLGPYIIGIRLGVIFVTPFSFASRLIGYVQTIMITGTGVVTPLATRLHAENKDFQQRTLFIEGGKLCTTLGLFFLGGFAFLGGAFLLLWTGKELEHAATLLIILTLGELLPLSQWITLSTVIGMDRHRLWALMSLLELVLVLILTVAFMWFDYSVYAIAWALAIPGTVCRGLVQMIYGCRILGISLWRYVSSAFLPALLGATVPTILLGVAVAMHEPETWFQLLSYSIGYGLLFTATAGACVLGSGDLRTMTAKWFANRRTAGGNAEAEDIRLDQKTHYQPNA